MHPSVCPSIQQSQTFKTPNVILKAARESLTDREIEPETLRLLEKAFYGPAASLIGSRKNRKVGEVVKASDVVVGKAATGNHYQGSVPLLGAVLPGVRGLTGMGQASIPEHGGPGVQPLGPGWGRESRMVESQSPVH